MTEPKRVQTEWFDRVWNKGEEEAIAELMSEDCEVEGLGAPVRGPVEYLDVYRALRNAFDKIHIEILESAGDDVQILAFARMTAIHRASGNAVETEFSFRSEVKNGQIVAARNVVDHFSLLVQMQAIPADLFAESLTGPPTTE